MPVMQNDICTIGATQITLSVLGASVFPTIIKSPPGCVGLELKLLSAVGSSGSTVMILPNTTPSLAVGGITTMSQAPGYPLVTGEMYPIIGPAQFYLAASGTQAIVAVNFYFSSNGATLN